MILSGLSTINNDAEKMKMFELDAMIKMEQNILSNNQDADSSFINEVTKFKGNEKEKLKSYQLTKNESLKVNNFNGSRTQKMFLQTSVWTLSLLECKMLKFINKM